MRRGSNLRIVSMGLVVIISLIGVFIFKSLSLPIPWMLGPLMAMLISQFFIRKISLEWPQSFRNLGLVIVGVAIGQSFQFDLFAGMGWIILIMFALNISLTAFSVGVSYFVQKIGKIPLKTSLTCTVPGGLSQIVTFAEEEKDINLAMVTYFHVIRVISIVLLIPFIVSGHVVSGIEGSGFKLETLLPLILLISVAWLSAMIGKKVKLPVSFFLGPVFLIIFFQLIQFETPEVPIWLLNIAQIFLGAYIGLLLKPHMVKVGARILFLGIASAIILLLFTYIQGVLLMYFLQYSLPTSFLSTAAGGLDQMSLIATSVGADISVVTVFQMFRLLFVFIVTIPLLKLACSWIDRKNSQNQRNEVDVSKS